MVDVGTSVNEYLQQLDWRVNANANQGYSLGGLILNLMPCVFPILAMKAASLAGHGGEENAKAARSPACMQATACKSHPPGCWVSKPTPTGPESAPS